MTRNLSNFKENLETLNGTERLKLLLQLCLLPSFHGSDEELTCLEELQLLALKNGTASQVAEAVLLQGIYYRKKGDYALAFEKAEFALKQFQEIENAAGAIKANNTLGHINFLQGDYTAALTRHFNSLQLNERIADMPGIAKSCNNIGSVYSHQGNYSGALKYLFRALSIYADTGGEEDIGAVRATLGNTYLMQGNYPEALKNLQSANEIYVKNNNRMGLCVSYGDMGVVLKKLGDYEKALASHSLSLEIALQIGHKRGESYSYNNMATIQIIQGNYAEALKNLTASIAIDREMGNKKGHAFSLGNTGIIYEKQGEYDTALKYYLQSFEMSGEAGHNSAVVEGARLLSNCYKCMGDIENAFKYYVIYHDLEKEMLGEKAQTQLINLRFQHDMEQTEKAAETERLKNAELKKALEKLNLDKSRNEQLFRNQLTELKSSALQTQMNPHFVFNSLNSIQQFIWEKNPEDANAYLNRFSILIRAVLDNSRRSFITLDEELTALEHYIELESLRFEHKFGYSICCCNSIQKEHIQVPPMMIQPFVENAIVHGLQSKKYGGKLLISVEKKDKNMLRIIIEDNGVGRIKAEQNNAGTNKTHQSVALRLAKERLDKMNEGAFTAAAIVITDLYDEHRKPAGTKVEINLPWNDSF